MSAYCPTCGSPAAPGAAFCASCGSLLGETGRPPAVASRKEAGRPCPYCRFPLKEGAAITVCPSCRAVHHEDCWRDNGGCAISGCGATARLAPGGATAAAPEPRSRRTGLIAGGAIATVAVIALIVALVAGSSGTHKRASDSIPRTPTSAPSRSAAAVPAGPPIAGNTLAIYASVPLQGPAGGQGKAIEDGAELALEQAGGRVGGYTVKYVRLDDSLASTGAADEDKAAQNARRATANANTVGYIGEYNSGISKVTIPVLNEAGIPQVSPSNTYVGLTRTGAGTERGEPAKYYPSGGRTYVRIVPNDVVQGAALATAAREQGCSSIHIWDSGTTYSSGLARNVEKAAVSAGLSVEGSDSIDPTAPGYKALAGNIGADCFVFTGEIESNGVTATRDAAAAPSVKFVFAGDGMCLNDTADPNHGIPARLAPRFKCTIATLDPAAFGPEGKRVFDDYATRYNVSSPDPYVIYGYESMSLLLDAIRRADAGGDVSREAVVDQLFRTRNRASVLGRYSIDPSGDTTLTDYGLYKIEGGQLTFDKVLKASAGG